MIFLNQNEVFGQLDIQEIFLYYDGPRLFTAENAAGQVFLINCLDSTEPSDTWLASAVSEKRLAALKDDSLQLRDAYTSPEIGYVVEFIADRSGSLLRHSLKNPAQLVDGDLPDTGIFIRSASSYAQHVNAVFAARSLNANIVLLHLYPDRRRVEAPAKAVGHILSAFQDYISVKLERVLVAAGLSRPEQPLFDVNLVGTFAGSFGVEMAVRGGDARIGEVLKDAIQDLGAADELDVFQERMESVEDIEVKAMSKFMSTLAAAETDLRVEAATPSDSEPSYAAAALPRLREAVKSLKRAQAIRTEMRTVVVEMVGLNLRTKRFELREIETGNRIAGGMAAEIFSSLKKAEIPSRYRVVLEGTVRQGEGGREKIESWRMISATKL